MKYMKAMVELIDLGEEEILTASGGCTEAAFIAGDACGAQNHHDKYYNCTNNGHLCHGGQ